MQIFSRPRRVPGVVCVLILLAMAPTMSRAWEHTTVAGAGGVPLSVLEAGDPSGPEILFIHGMSQSALAWLPQLRSSLGARYRLVAFDLRGHGGSGKPWRAEDYSDSKIWADDIAAVIAAKNLMRPVIVAWSYGGHALLSYVRHYGTSHIGAIDFTGTLAGLVPVERKPSPETERLLAGSKLRSSRDLLENIEGYRAMARGLSAHPLPKELEEIAFLTGLMQPSYVRRAMTQLPLHNEDLADKIDVPVLISVGSGDREWPLERCRAAAAMLPHARLSVYDGFGHFPSAEAPERFNRELEGLVHEIAP